MSWSAPVFSVGGVGTTAAVDSTGADFIVIAVSYYGSGTISDSKGNTWTPLTLQSATVAHSRLYYCVNPTVGSGHTFSYTGGSFESLEVLGFPGTDGTPFDVQNGATGTGGVTSLATGSVTPSVNDELVIAGVSVYDGGLPTIDGGFTIGTGRAGSGASLASSIAYLIQTSATAANPTWSFTAPGYSDCAATIATFKSAASGSAIKTFNGLAYASTKTVDGLAIANVKTWDGLA